MDELDISILRKRSVHGVLALVSRTFVLNLISLLSFLVISTQLLARDLGIYVAVLAIQRVISFFTDFGLGAALVQKKDEVTSDDIRTAFTIQSGVTFFIFVLIFILKDTISSFFKLEPSGEHLLLVLVFSIFLSSFKTIPSILLERAVNFQKLIIPQMAEAIVFNFVLIILLTKNFGIDSFSWAFISSSLIGIPIYYLVSPWPVGIGISKESLSHLKYGAQFQAKNILATVKDDLLTVILTKILSFTEIGYIGFAQRLSFFVYRYVVDSVTKVTFSTYSRIQDSEEIMKKAIEKSLFFVSAAMFPLLLGLMASSPYLIQYFHRWNKWEPAVISIIFFSLNALVSSMSGILINVLDATGRVKTTLKLMVFWTTATWVLTPILIKLYGFNGVSIASFVISLSIIATIVLVRRMVKFDFLKSIYKPAVSSFIMLIFILISEKIFAKDLLTLLIICGFGGILYITIMMAIARKEISHDLSVVFKRR